MESSCCRSRRIPASGCSSREANDAQLDPPARLGSLLYPHTLRPTLIFILPVRITRICCIFSYLLSSFSLKTGLGFVMVGTLTCSVLRSPRQSVD
ncbi:hypothetical protein EJ03DRAFT_28367 [Teratosphaeria nubilosa]|uniref:Uncharacterized protein n=1 Tax=Teratosphaeria nubilosa TaxID=161662 RepID=A0A6G1KWH7_9PEZI|nr:hypothetical protein EJ03DRAFT_28367 [Teratosphaeria nubilosa]